ncbi:MAG: hypothetical protein FWE94_02755 [Coriobacteriia bacterium]|nr:hypothetical protein [Coriobacteriia bacterium]
MKKIFAAIIAVLVICVSVACLVSGSPVAHASVGVDGDVGIVEISMELDSADDVGVSAPTLALWFFAGGSAVTLIVMLIEVKKHRPVQLATNADRYISEGGVHMTAAEDVFLRTQSKTVKVSSSSGGRGRR